MLQGLLNRDALLGVESQHLVQQVQGLAESTERTGDGVGGGGHPVTQIQQQHTKASNTQRGEGRAS